MTHVHVYVSWSTREWPLYLSLAWNVQCIHMLYVKYWILCTTLHTLFIKESALFKLAFAIFNSSFHQFNSSTSRTSSRCAIHSIFNLICIVHTPLHSPHSTLLVFGTGGLWYRGEGHLLETLHPSWPGPNLFYVWEEEEPNRGHCFTDPRRRRGVRRTLGIH